MVPKDESIATAWQRCTDYHETHRVLGIGFGLGLWNDAKEALEAGNGTLFIEKARAGIEACLARMPKTEFVEELQFGWWASNLVKALLNQGETVSAQSVLKIFFSLPARAHASATDDELAYLNRMAKVA